MPVLIIEMIAGRRKAEYRVAGNLMVPLLCRVCWMLQRADWLLFFLHENWIVTDLIFFPDNFLIAEEDAEAKTAG